ncbi:MAG: NfeD family protein [Jatrophihabitantaceae bacterium]
MTPWLVWLIIAGVLAGGEALSGTFVLLMMSGGALGGAVAAALGGGLLIQVVVALVVTVGLVWLVRPVAIRHLNPGPAAITGSDALVGREAVVLNEVTRDGGRVRLNGAEWSARSKDPNQQLPAGTRVSVIAIDGATAVVWQDPFGGN